MLLYLDTSALVKLYVDEPDSDDVKALVAEADVVATSVIAYAEARATFERRRRSRQMTSREVTLAVAALDHDWARLLAVPTTHDLGLSAGRLAATHGVRGGDAVHLAAFEFLVSQADDDDVRFSCADERLTRAARSLR